MKPNSNDYKDLAILCLFLGVIVYFCKGGGLIGFIIMAAIAGFFYIKYIIRQDEEIRIQKERDKKIEDMLNELKKRRENKDKK